MASKISGTTTCLADKFVPFGASLKPLGDAFIKLVKMVIVPLIFLTIVTGIAGMGDMKAVGRVASKAFISFLSFSTLALIIGLIVANIVQPGTWMNIDPATLDAQWQLFFGAVGHGLFCCTANRAGASRDAGIFTIFTEPKDATYC